MIASTRILCLFLIALLATQPGCFVLNALLPKRRSSPLDTSILKAQGIRFHLAECQHPLALIRTMVHVWFLRFGAVNVTWKQFR